MPTFLQQLRNAITIDFETFGIEKRPAYPSKPVSVSIKYGNKPPSFYAWGHPTGNNCTLAEARCDLKAAWHSGRLLLFQNGLFDVDVAEVHFGLKPPWSRIHDSMIMMFLRDPHAPDYHLKKSAERILGEPPDERDAVVDWLVKHQPVKGVTIKRGEKSEHYAGRYIAYAPGHIVEPYCNGDVDRTYKLALKVGAELSKRKMLDAYAREMRMLPVILRMERHGVRVNVSKLKKDITLYEKELARLDRWLRKKLKSKDVNLDAPQQVAQALVDAKLADPAVMGITKTGKLAANKLALKLGITDPQVYAALRWRGAVGTCLKTFLRPWYAQAKKGGRIYIQWNATRRESSGGARTGRLSSSPNLQNVPKVFKPLFREHGGGQALPRVPLRGLPDVPKVRGYVLADKGHVLIDRDFSSQELRVLGFYEDDDIAAAFAKTPKLDLHKKVADDLNITRTAAKTINFAILYGVGNGHLAEMLDVSVPVAKAIKLRYFDNYPSVRDLIDDLKDLAKEGKPLKTWGGRQYYCEKPTFKNGRLWDFSYKLLNYLIQGSSADLTKEAMIAFHEGCGENEWLLASVHDELLASVPKATWKKSMARMRRIMSTNWLGDVPMLSTGKVGPTFAAMKECA